MQHLTVLRMSYYTAVCYSQISRYKGSGMFQEFPRLFWGQRVVKCNRARWTQSCLSPCLVKSRHLIKIGESVINAVKSHNSEILLIGILFSGHLLIWAKYVETSLTDKVNCLQYVSLKVLEVAQWTVIGKKHVKKTVKITLEIKNR